MNRRQLMAAAPAAMVAGAMPALATGDNPVLPIFREYQAARTKWHGLMSMPEHADDDTPEVKAASDREMAAFRAIIEETPTTLAGIAAMVSVLWDFDGPCMTPGSEDYAEICSHPNNKIMAAIWRVASGENGLPPEHRVG